MTVETRAETAAPPRNRQSTGPRSDARALSRWTRTESAFCRPGRRGRPGTPRGR